MADEGDGPSPREQSAEAELRQIEALNRVRAVEETRRAPPGGPHALDEDHERDTGRDGGSDRNGGGADREGADHEGGAVRRRDALLLDTGRGLAEADSINEVARTVSRLAAPDFTLDGVVIFGVTEKFLNLLGQHGYRTNSDRTFRMPLTTGYPAAAAARTGRPVYLSSPAEYRRRFPATWPLSARKGRESWAFLPLVTAGRITGVWLASFRTRQEFGPDERNLLATAARLIAHALERNRTGEAELALSRGLRRSMGSGGTAGAGMSVATRYLPTGGGLMVGGDWYDVINLPAGRIALVIGDVQGHDVHAASLMAQLRTAVHAYAAEGHGPDAVLARTSRFLTSLDEDRFATCIYIEADPATGLLHMARAGHPHPVLRLPDGTCMLKHIRGGLPLGLMPDEDDYPVTDLELRAGEVLMLCTDGLIETGGHDMYTGWVRVRDALSPGPTDDLEGMADRLMAAVTDPASPSEQEQLAPRNEDDIALLLLRRDNAGGHTKPPVRRLVLTIEQDQAEGLAQARTELQALLHDWANPEQVDTAVLLASELLGNVLVHTDQTAALTAVVSGERGARRLQVDVTDRGDELPHQRTPGELASSGRGLVLLDILSDQWSVRPESEGKTVWFSIDEGDPADHGAHAPEEE